MPFSILSGTSATFEDLFGPSLLKMIRMKSRITVAVFNGLFGNSKKMD